MAKDPGSKLKTALKFKIGEKARSFNNQIGGDDRVDLLQIRIGRRSSLNLSLTRLKANADLALLDQKGKKLFQSRKAGKQSESIVAPLDAGVYFIEVKPGSRKDNTRYRLTATASNTNPSLTVASLSVRAGTAALITGSFLKTTDAEQQAGDLLYTLTSIPQNGRLLLNSVALEVGGRFTQADIDSERLSYISSGNTSRVTDNSTNDVLAGISGSNLIWNNYEGPLNQPTAVKAFFYNGQTSQALQLTGSGVINATVQGISGSDAVWLGSNGTTNQVFLYTGTTGTSTQLANDGRSVTNAFISGSNIAWSSTDGQLSKAFFYNRQTGQTNELTASGITTASVLGASESRIVWLGGSVENNNINVDLFLFDLQTGINTRLTNDALVEYQAGTSGVNAVWNSVSLDGQTFKSFFYNGQTGQTTELTSPGITLSSANFFSGTQVLWTGWPNINTDSEVFLYDGSTSVSTQLTNNDTNDVGNRISDSNIIWTGFNGVDTDIFLYDTTTKTTIELTNNNENDNGALIDGSNIAWNTNDGTDSEIVFRRFVPTDQFSFSVTDNSGGTATGTFSLTINQA